MLQPSEAQQRIAQSGDPAQQLTFVFASMIAAGVVQIKGHTNLTTMQSTEEWRTINSLSISEVKELMAQYLYLKYGEKNPQFFQTPRQARDSWEDVMYFSVRYNIAVPISAGYQNG